MTDERKCKGCGSTSDLSVITRWLEDEQCLGLLGFLCPDCIARTEKESE